MRISDWSSDVCSSDLRLETQQVAQRLVLALEAPGEKLPVDEALVLGAQARILGSQRRELADALDGAGEARDGPRQDIQDRADRIGRVRAQLLDHDGLDQIGSAHV